eukprot:gb/GECH01009842.1/.p1 GENE.gb/GECH01009842.1/~~gb/GECH01009842.1/.p1  ORF type:complete len:156 (+),score=7.46 gb/GECH01009842.1/:1-468(+)
MVICLKGAWSIEAQTQFISFFNLYKDDFELVAQEIHISKNEVEIHATQYVFWAYYNNIQLPNGNQISSFNFDTNFETWINSSPRHHFFETETVHVTPFKPFICREQNRAADSVLIEEKAISIAVFASYLGIKYDKRSRVISRIISKMGSSVQFFI